MPRLRHPPCWPWTASDEPAIRRAARLAADYARFLFENLEGERGRGKLLSAETYRRLHSDDGRAAWGLGWGIRHLPVWGTVITHIGSNGRWYHLAWASLDREIGLALASNGPNGARTEAAFEEALQATLRWLATREREPQADAGGPTQLGVPPERAASQAERMPLTTASGWFCWMTWPEFSATIWQLRRESLAWSRWNARHSGSVPRPALITTTGIGNSRLETFTCAALSGMAVSSLYNAAKRCARKAVAG